MKTPKPKIDGGMRADIEEVMIALRHMEGEMIINDRSVYALTSSVITKPSKIHANILPEIILNTENVTILIQRFV